MGEEIKHLRVKFIIGSIALIVGFVAANIALFQLLERMGVQHPLRDYCRYILGLGGLAAMIFGAMLIRETWILRNVLGGKYKSPTNLSNAQNIRAKRSNKMLPTKIVERKIIILRSRLDHDTVKLLAEKLKEKLFHRMLFFKPKPGDIRVVSINRYFEPYIVVGGKYAVDYYKKHVFPVQVNEEAAEIGLFGKRFKPMPFNNNSQSPIKIIELDGEALFHYEDETYFILDKTGREIAPEQIPIAPSEQQSLEKLAELGINMGKLEISREEEIDFLRSRIVNRPSDGEVTKEIFEVNERTVVYSPIYQLTFQNVKTEKKATVKIDGITGETIRDKHKTKTMTKPIEDSLAVNRMKQPIVENKRVERKTDLPESSSLVGSINQVCKTSPDFSKKVTERLQFSKVSESKRELGFPARVVGEVLHEGDDATEVTGDLNIPSRTTVYKNLVVKGCLEIGDYCQILGKVEALRDVKIGANTEIEEDVFSGGNVRIGPNSVIHGSVKSDGHVEIGENAAVEGGLHSKSSVELNRFAKVYAHG